MLSAIVVLFTIVLLILCLHVYARWCLLRRARRRRRDRRRLVFAAASQDGAAGPVVRGLDREVVKSLPVFTYTAAKCPAEPEESMECAVCLSEFQENEMGRVMPLCKHRFHIECIDMWFHSHATCPLCRAAVEPAPPAKVSDSVHIQIEPPLRRSSASRAGMRMRTSPRRNRIFFFFSSCCCCRYDGMLELERAGAEGLRSLEEEVGSPGGGGQGFKSPLSRMRSLKRLLSIDLRFHRGGSPPTNPTWRGAQERWRCGGGGAVSPPATATEVSDDGASLAVGSIAVRCRLLRAVAPHILYIVLHHNRFFRSRCS
ncbi:unnamed protein product [Spirodela intermedia]|uniref:RING-type E3 ubiquitin transferase n=1 Tax=Spirodela intermedia TaxID=51605 RepID=A0A7I8IA64_SPIIN|nr:unnamed protein product [Spirodela intermedia]CAA6654344.1 unnamed protein product [Spirodela intermedia]